MQSFRCLPEGRPRRALVERVQKPYSAKAFSIFTDVRWERGKSGRPRGAEASLPEREKFPPGYRAETAKPRG
jgi:hypothetical protein